MTLSPLTFVVRLSLLAPLILSALGCASSGPPTVVTKAAAPVVEAVPSLREVRQTVEQASYDATGRDPFLSYLEAASTPVEVGAPPLARHALGALSVIGVVSATATPMAMIETPAGKGYRVRVGDRIGDRGGRVHAIGPDHIVVRETFYDPLLGAQHKEQTLSLRRGPTRSAVELLQGAE